jgi:serine/threonine protein phosphatase PrpC
MSTRRLLRYRSAGLSDRGRVRANDEDAFLIEETLGFFTVADGMGGHRAGEVASRLAADAAARVVREEPSERDAADVLRRAFQLAHESIQAAEASDPACRGMGTTLVALLAEASGSACVAHVGDSRAYLRHGGHLICLTRDHSLLARLARDNPGLPLDLLKPRSPYAHVLTRSLGMEGPLVPDVQPIFLEPGDRVLLCCDGLTDMVPDEQIAGILSSEPDPEACCRRLVDAANAVGGEDNITVLIVDVCAE